MKRTGTILLALLISCQLLGEDGYQLWLRYTPVSDKSLQASYRSLITGIVSYGQSPTLAAAVKELQTGLQGLLGKSISTKSAVADGCVIIGTISSPIVKQLLPATSFTRAGDEGFIILTSRYNNRKVTVIAGNTDIAVMYGAFHFLRLLQTQQSIASLNILSVPKIQRRLLNHWDNLNRTVERGYAGASIWDWHRLPGYIDQRYIDYARANASIGINGTVLTNVNANALILSRPWLEKVAALADVFRIWGIKVYLTARFSAPVETGGLKTADPLDPEVQAWWNNKVNEIYQLIPDFGGFLVKANSEGQPGPQNYKRTHADGANMLSKAIASHGGIVMWRAFVYSNETPDDRFKQAYNEFKPLDGKFNSNVLVQVKNGPIDFQPREPFHPLFGAMPLTPLAMEFQITQEYLGQATNLVYLATMFKEALDANTHASQVKGNVVPTVAHVVDGSVDRHPLSAMAGVSNIGSDRNWTGHPFAQSNWYAYGRLAWDHDLNADVIADEWIRQTFTNDKSYITAVKKIMMSSHETLVNYMTPLGLHHIMGNGHHYGPSPWSADLPRADWNPVYYHRADSIGIGFDRTKNGSNALAQYAKEVSGPWSDVNTCPEEYLLWFHHVRWTHVMKSGKTLWDELCRKYYEGVDSVRAMQRSWDKMEKYIDSERFRSVKMLLSIQEQEAVWWRNACVLYFQEFSKMPIPAGFEKPDKTLAYYKSLRFPFAPGN